MCWKVVKQSNPVLKEISEVTGSITCFAQQIENQKNDARLQQIFVMFRISVHAHCIAISFVCSALCSITSLI